MTVEDFTTWTEVEPNGKLSQNVSQAIWANMTRNEICYLYKAHTTPSDFQHSLEFILSSIDVNADASSNFLAYIWVVCENYGRPDFVETGKSIKLVIMEKGNSTTEFNLYLTHKDDIVQDTSVDLDVGTDYYLTIKKLGPVVTVKIYSDRFHTTVVDVLSINLAGEDEEDMSFSYVETTASCTTGGDVTDQSDGTVTYLDLNDPRPDGTGYYLFVGSEGYDDYLDCQRVVMSPLDVVVAKRDYPNSYNLLADDEPNQTNFIYGTLYMVGNIIRVNKISRETLEIVDYADSPSLPSGPYCIQTYGNYIFVGSYSGRLYRWTKSPLAYVDYITLDTGGAAMAVLDMVADYSTSKLYCIGYYDWVGDRVWRVDIPTFTKDGTVSVPTSAGAYTSPRLKPQLYDGFLYYPIPVALTSAGKIVRVIVSPLGSFAYSAILTLDTNDRVPCGMALYGNRLIVSCITPTPWRPLVVKIDTTTFTREDSIECLSSDGSWCVDGEMKPNSDYYYFLTYNNIVEIDLDSWTRTGDIVPIDSEGGYYPLSLVSAYLFFAPATEEIIITNDGGELELNPILWKESQECGVAIRPVPLRSGPKVDTDTWVLETRTITFRVRLSDAEKTTLQSIFDAKKIVVISTDSRWTYSGWLRGKPVKYEYRVVDGTLKPWLYELKFDCESFDYIP